MQKNGTDREMELLRAIREMTCEMVELRKDLAVERAARAKAQAENEQLKAEVAELKAKLGTDSSNSSKPPSSDGPQAKPRTRSLRTKSTRKPGGQPGHGGVSLEMATNVDHVEAHRPERCRGCGSHLEDSWTPVSVEARQVFDLPEDLRLHVTEHRLYALKCPGCASITKAEAPDGVTRQVQYGPRIEALGIYLGNTHYLPLKRASQLLADLFGATISPATILKMTTRAAQVITDVFRPVAVGLLACGPVAHADETGFKVAGKTLWAHSMSNPQATWIQVHPQRGTTAMNDIGILGKFTGTLVHDAWAPYDTYANIGAHQLCCAHSGRELQGVKDQHNHPEGQWCWAEQADDAFAAIIHDPATLDKQRHLITSALTLAQERDPDPPGKVGKKHKALRKRLKTRLNDYLRFATDAAVPPTNNPAEQEIRMIKIKQKIAGTMRTLKGANDFTTIRSYLSTARKHATRPLQALTSLTSPNPWLPATP